MWNVFQKISNDIISSGKTRILIKHNSNTFVCFIYCKKGEVGDKKRSMYKYFDNKRQKYCG